MAEWWRGAVIYQIYPRSFQDTNGDGVGDLRGITDRLEHVARLGADAVWLSPVFTSPMADMGYDVSDHRDIDPLFGTLADFDALIARAHALGLRVIVDQVLSHTSDRHPWFVESRSSRDNPRADWYVWADPRPDGSPPNNWLSVFGGPAWTWDSRRRQYYLHNFLASQPHMNFHNPAVQDALLDAVRFWLDRGLDGFRIDSVNYHFHDPQLRPNPPLPGAQGAGFVNPYEMQLHRFSKTRPENIAFLQRLRALLDEYPDRTSVGEIGESQRSIEVMAEYTRGEDRLHMAYSFDMLGPAFSARHFRSRIEAFFAGAPDGWPSWSFSNHDVPRHVTRWAGHARDPRALARQACMLLVSFQGTIGLYQGEELGLPEAELEFHQLTDPAGIRLWPEYKGRDGCRTPMPWTGARSGGFTTGRPWLPVPRDHRRLNAADQEDDPASVLSFYRRALAWRRANPVLRAAPTKFHRTAEPVLAFGRGDDVDAPHFAFNLSAEPHPLTVRGLILDAEAPSQGAGLEGARLALGPNGFAVLRPAGRAAPRIAS
jgi:alpha-glucosidase